ncbi:MAG: PAC2 family protein [Candidatus Micrarchaeota archaeon]|nr:PAC2 family protein [Candidatus Micrarchaeota archaeon]MDE1834640.1 PAC2 family protein [Candidatus Micrarchaeota archaeon]MDE1859524.1 PAC2 family protein [Candidatus Micrarchaeota archaeon]
MKSTKIYYKKLKFKNPILVVGLPGIGSVGALVGEHLKNELGAKRFATLYSPHFIHQTIMLKSGYTRLISNRFYYKELKSSTLILLIGDTQAPTPEGQYDINEKIVRFFKHLGGKQIYTIGGYSAGNHYIQTPRVFGIATDKQTKDALSQKGVLFGQTNGAIWGSAGMVVSFAKKNKLHAACIMGETGALEIDANAARAVLEVLKKVIGVNVNLDNIDKIKAETEKLLKELEAASKPQEGQGATSFPYIR